MHYKDVFVESFNARFAARPNFSEYLQPSYKLLSMNSKGEETRLKKNVEKIHRCTSEISLFVGAEKNGNEHRVRDLRGNNTTVLWI